MDVTCGTELRFNVTPGGVTVQYSTVQYRVLLVCEVLVCLVCVPAPPGVFEPGTVL